MEESTDVKYNNLILNMFPSIKEAFEENTSWQAGIETAIILTYEDVLVPYIVEQLNQNNLEQINKIVNLIEDMITSNDDYLFNVALIGVLEALRGKQVGQKIRDFLKERSLEEYDNLEIYKKH